MDVDLYVYDLSKGLARMYSRALTGIQIDAIYHTSIVFNGVEYYFGQGIQRSIPGSTHHGRPVEVLRLGQTELPIEVVEEYVQSLTEVYSPESYDLFLRNCNNFTQDLSMFLVGKSIPEHIRNLPQTFLNTPLGQMLKPQIDMALRGVTQGTGVDSVPAQVTGARPHAPATMAAAATPREAPVATVRVVSNTSQLEQQLASAKGSCAVIFFTSATCPPCKMVYPTYDELAAEAGDRAVLIKVDISTAYDVSMKYQVRATPTFMTFLRGQKLDEWKGANPAQLRGNVRLLLEMAYPPHRHAQLRVPSLQRVITNYVLYKKVPPLEKLLLKIPAEYRADPTITRVVEFIRIRHAATANGAGTTTTTTTKILPADAALPDLQSFATFLQTTFHQMPSDSHFAIVDLVRLLFLDHRVSAYFAEREGHLGHPTLLTVLSRSRDDQLQSCPYNLRIVMLQLACNLFSGAQHTVEHFFFSGSSNTATTTATTTTNSTLLRETCLRLATNCLLDKEHANLRVVAASFAYNLAAINHNARIEDRTTNPGPSGSGSGSGSGNGNHNRRRCEPLPEEDQVELTASVVEAIARETESVDALHGLLFALGLLVYEAPLDGPVVDLCRAMGIAETVIAKGKGEDAAAVLLKKEPLIKEVGCELLAKGL